MKDILFSVGLGIISFMIILIICLDFFARMLADIERNSGKKPTNEQIHICSVVSVVFSVLSGVASTLIAWGSL